MSYILDALKKAERQRPPGPVPDLFTVHGPLLPPPRRPVRAIVAAALLLLALPVSAWVWIGTGRRGEGPARPPAAASPHLREAAPIAQPLPPAIAAQTPPVPDRAVAVARRPLVERPHTAAPPAPPPLAPPTILTVHTAPDPGLPTPVTAPVTAVDAVKPPPGGEAQPAPVAAGEASSGVTPSAAPVPVPEPVPAASVAVAAEEPPADGRVLDLAELPDPVRAALPKLLVSGHVWSEEPSLRLLSVDDRLLHEGQEAGPGVRLLEITQAGAVFVSRGWRFRVAGGRP